MLWISKARGRSWVVHVVTKEMVSLQTDLHFNQINCAIINQCPTRIYWSFITPRCICGRWAQSITDMSLEIGSRKSNINTNRVQPNTPDAQDTMKQSMICWLHEFRKSVSESWDKRSKERIPGAIPSKRHVCTFHFHSSIVNGLMHSSVQSVSRCKRVGARPLNSCERQGRNALRPVQYL